MLKIILFLCMLFAATALECRISNGVEYVKIRGNLQPGGCPDGLKCVNETCSTIQKSDAAKNNGQRKGFPCVVKALSVRNILVYIKDTEEEEDRPWTYSSGGCGWKDGKNLTCVGDWGEQWEEECPYCDYSTGVRCSDKCKEGCGNREIVDGSCDVNANYARGTCRLAGEEGWAEWSIWFVVIICVIGIVGISSVLWACATGKWPCAYC